MNCTSSRCCSGWMILVILVGGDARDLGVRSGQVVRGAGLAGLVSPGPGGEGGVVLGAQQEAGAGPRAELPGVEDRSHHHLLLLLRPGLRAVVAAVGGAPPGAVSPGRQSGARLLRPVPAVHAVRAAAPGQVDRLPNISLQDIF